MQGKARARAAWTTALAAGLLSLGLASCPANRPMQIPPGEPAVIAKPGGQGASDPSTTPITANSLGGMREDGAACFESAQCASNICEGASCDGTQPGTCVPSDRPCAADRAEFCGCDGLTFASSSSCPGEAFAHRGACENKAAEAGDATTP